MKKLLQAEIGEYEQRYTSFVAVDKHAALRYLQAKQPDIEWEITERTVKSSRPEPHMQFTPYVELFIAPKNEKLNDDRYDLSEVDFAE